MMQRLFPARHIRPIITTVGMLCIFTYVMYHAMNGERGVAALIRLTHQLKALHATLDDVRADRLEMEHRVHLLRTESLDLDILEEQARSILGFADPQEDVYFIPDTPS